MGNIIAVLPESVANQIAAGEVIQQPASAIKELMENSIDAGATRIDVSVKDGGRSLIQVADNGKGMSADDAVTCFERHATSKLHTSDDLFSIRTMGFRGEALASIAAIAQVVLVTRRAEDELGCKVCIAGSRLESTEKVVAEPGTRFSIRNIFFNVPARRKFMGTAVKQFQAVRAEFIQIALAHPGCRMSLTSDGTTVWQLAAGNLRQRIVALFGETLNKSLYPIEVDTDVIHICGFIADPEASRKRNAEQFFFVNDRFIKHPYFRKAIQSVYEPLISEGMQPIFFLFLTANPNTIDVNISPTKTEVKFENEQIIWPILQASVRECLGKFNAVPSIDFDQENAPVIEVFHPDEDIRMPQVQYNPQYNPFKKASFPASHAFSSPAEKELKEECEPYGFSSDSSDMDDTLEDVLKPLFDEDTSQLNLKEAYQLFGRYIAIPSGDALLLIDQHRAGIRLHYERYAQRLTAHRTASQTLLFPEEMELSATRKIDFDAIRTALEDLGFGFDTSVARQLLITAIPDIAEGLAPCDMVNELIDSYVEMNVNNSLQGAPFLQERNYRLSLRMARQSAIPYGQILSKDEMARLCHDLFQLELHNLTPDGKHIILRLSAEELIKRFN